MKRGTLAPEQVEAVRIDLGLRARLLAKKIAKHTALMERWADRAYVKKPTKAQLRKAARDKALGERYLAKAHALGVYGSDDY